MAIAAPAVRKEGQTGRPEVVGRGVLAGSTGAARGPGLPVPSRPDVRSGPPSPLLTRRWLRFGIPAALATYSGSTLWVGVARAVSPGRSLRASGPFAHSEVAALRHPAYAGHLRRLDGTGNPSILGVAHPRRVSGNGRPEGEPHQAARGGWACRLRKELMQAAPSSPSAPTPRKRQRPPGRRPPAVRGTLGVPRDRASPPGPGWPGGREVRTPRT
jgi:hypothetical protein